MSVQKPCGINDWICPEPLAPARFESIRRRMVLEYCKWDPQVGDISTLAPFPMVIPATVARELSLLAEGLAAETESAERELLSRPDLIRRLGLPRAIQQVLLDESIPLTAVAARVIRFDFHPTAEGWRISEANSDVPGGYTESSHFPRLMAEHWPCYHSAGNPLATFADAITWHLGEHRHVGLLAAPGFVEDQQVIRCIANELHTRKWTAVFGRPSQLEWNSGSASLRLSNRLAPSSVIIRFFQGEWLARLRDRQSWRHLFRGGNTPVCNPGLSVLSESKRFPLVWNELKTPLPHWRSLLPKTRDPRSVHWHRDSEWLLKGAFGNNGDEVADRHLQTRRDWRKTQWSVRLHPRQWAAQRRFAALAIATPLGDMYPCLGVYTVNGRACGIYGRMSAKPFIDYAAIDVAILVNNDDGDRG